MNLPGNKCAWQESFLSLHQRGFGKQANGSWARDTGPLPLKSDDYILSWESGHRSYIASD